MKGLVKIFLTKATRSIVFSLKRNRGEKQN